jgi:hypothetical protein
MIDIYLYLKMLRLILSIVFLTLAWTALVKMILSQNYWKKIFLLAVAYNCIIVFVLYQLFVRDILGDLFFIIPIIFINFIFTFVTGFGIVNNLIQNKNNLK